MKLIKLLLKATKLPFHVVYFYGATWASEELILPPLNTAAELGSASTTKERPRLGQMNQQPLR
jgi:hypothetical protein